MADSNGALNGGPLARRTHVYTNYVRRDYVRTLFRCSNAPGAASRDLPGVEAEPVHAAHVSRVLDFQAAVHDDAESAPAADLGALEADDSELEPRSEERRV